MLVIFQAANVTSSLMAYLVLGCLVILGLINLPKENSALFGKRNLYEEGKKKTS